MKFFAIKLVTKLVALSVQKCCFILNLNRSQRNLSYNLLCQFVMSNGVKERRPIN